MLKKLIVIIATVSFFVLASPNQIVQAEEIDPMELVKLSKTIDNMNITELAVYIDGLLAINKPTPIDEKSIEFAIKKAVDGVDNPVLFGDTFYDDEQLQKWTNDVKQSTYSDDVKKQFNQSIQEDLEATAELNEAGTLVIGFILIVMAIGFSIWFFVGLTDTLNERKQLKKELESK